MGTVDAVITILAVWTGLSVVLVAAWSYLAAREHLGFVVHEPRSHVSLVDAPAVRLAPVIDLDARRRTVRRSA